MKKALGLFMLCFFALSSILSSCTVGSSEASASTDNLLLNDIQVDSRGKFDAPYFDKDGNMIMPLEFVCQMQGFEYSADGSSATVKLGDKTVTVTKGSNILTTFSEEIKMPVKTVLKSGTFYVPAEPVLTALGYTYKVSSDENGNVAEAEGMRGNAKYETIQKYENFDTDPGIYGERNEVDVARHNIVNLDFGYKNYNGENVIGGLFQRSMDKGYYAIDLSKELTLNDDITFSGKFLVPKNDGSSDVLFGLFSEESQDYRPNNYMCMRLDGDAPNKYFVYFEHGTLRGEIFGTVGNFTNPRYQDSRGDNPGDPDDRLRASPDQWHSFSMTYNPNGDNGYGSMVGFLDGKKFYYNLHTSDPNSYYNTSQGITHKEAGVKLTQFGVMTQTNIGQSMEVYFKELSLNGDLFTDLSPNGGWKSENNVLKNHLTSAGKGVNEFGYRALSNIDMNKPGEFGGIIWRLDENRFNTPSYAGMPTGFWILHSRFMPRER